MYVLKHENEWLETKSLYTNQTASCDFVHSYDCMSNSVWLKGNREFVREQIILRKMKIESHFH